MKGNTNQQVMNEFQEFVIDPQGFILESRGLLFRYRGMGVEPMKGKALAQVLGPLYTEEVRKICTEALELGKTASVVVDAPFQSGIIALLFVSVPFVKNERIRGVVVSIYAITISRRLERHENLRQKMKVIALLASQIVHNMNNPIAAVLNAIGGLLVDDPEKIDPQRLRKELREIQEQIYEVAIVTNALTAFSSDSRQDFKLIQINHVIENALNLLKLIFTNKKISYHVDLDEQLPRIMGNEVTLEQAFVNLCRNAVEAMPDGGVLSIVSQKDEQFKDFITVTIADQGLGIAPDLLDSVFDPFFTTKADGHKGLGLTVCYGIISNHNGNIEVTSREGGGIMFQIVLPIAKI